MKDYRSSVGKPYECPEFISWTCLPVLPFLIGRKWDQTALNYVHSLEPSYIRVVTEGIALDARERRVTVHVDRNGIILGIQQEVAVGCVGYKDADDMDSKYLVEW